MKKKDMEVHMSKPALATMDYGFVPVLIELREGEGTHPPLHASVLAPIKGIQVIRIFYNRENAAEIMKSSPENWVGYIDSAGHHHRYAPNSNGVSMILCLN